MKFNVKLMWMANVVLILGFATTGIAAGPSHSTGSDPAAGPGHPKARTEVDFKRVGALALKRINAIPATEDFVFENGVERAGGVDLNPGLTLAFPVLKKRNITWKKDEVAKKKEALSKAIQEIAAYGALLQGCHNPAYEKMRDQVRAFLVFVANKVNLAADKKIDVDLVANWIFRMREAVEVKAATLGADWKGSEKEEDEKLLSALSVLAMELLSFDTNKVKTSEVLKNLEKSSSEIFNKVAKNGFRTEKSDGVTDLMANASDVEDGCDLKAKPEQKEEKKEKSDDDDSDKEPKPKKEKEDKSPVGISKAKPAPVAPPVEEPVKPEPEAKIPVAPYTFPDMFRKPFPSEDKDKDKEEKRETPNIADLMRTPEVTPIPKQNNEKAPAATPVPQQGSNSTPPSGGGSPGMAPQPPEEKDKKKDSFDPSIFSQGNPRRYNGGGAYIPGPMSGVGGTSVPGSFLDNSPSAKSNLVPSTTMSETGNLDTAFQIGKNSQTQVNTLQGLSGGFGVNGGAQQPAGPRFPGRSTRRSPVAGSQPGTVAGPSVRGSQPLPNSISARPLSGSRGNEVFDPRGQRGTL